MNIHEHQAKEILRHYDIAVPRGKAVFNPEEAVAAATEFNSKVMAVKAQIHAGGRGKAGGVKIARSLSEVELYARELLGKTLYTKQTGAEGKVVRRLLIEEGADIEKEYYLSLAIDYEKAKVTIIASTEGGMDIEDVAENAPDKIIKENIDPEIGLQSYQLLNIADKLQLTPSLTTQFIKIVLNLYKLFLEKDCSLVEINPLISTRDEILMALDAKISFDSSSLYRHPDIAKLRDPFEDDPLEARAADSDMSFVSLGGNIGCLVIGAGLAMATMDAIKYYGAEPANFLDCGGSTTIAKAKEAFDIILAEKKVEGILVNIFGGITRCDYVAGGILESLRDNDIKLPIVIRLEGTNSDIANRALKESEFKFEFASSLTEGAKKIIALTNGGKR